MNMVGAFQQRLLMFVCVWSFVAKAPASESVHNHFVLWIYMNSHFLFTHLMSLQSTIAFIAGHRWLETVLETFWTCMSTTVFRIWCFWATVSSLGTWNLPSGSMMACFVSASPVNHRIHPHGRRRKHKGKKMKGKKMRGKRKRGS